MNSVYCPVCQKTLIAENTEEVESGEHDRFIFVHDNIVHTDDESATVNSGIN